jgi:hypothetical protein
MRVMGQAFRRTSQRPRSKIIALDGLFRIIGAIVSKVILPKSELTDLVLAEIREREGCAGVDGIVILENINPRSAANWEISIIAASSGDPAHVQRMAFEVQCHLQPLYRLR